MFCPSCRMMRVDNDAPCSYCGAPSPRLGSQTGQWNNSSSSWPAEMSPNARNQQEARQIPFGSGVTSLVPEAWAQVSPSWGQQAQFPVPSQGYMAMPQQSGFSQGEQSHSTMQMVPVREGGPMVPA